MLLAPYRHFVIIGKTIGVEPFGVQQRLGRQGFGLYAQRQLKPCGIIALVVGDANGERSLSGGGVGCETAGAEPSGASVSGGAVGGASASGGFAGSGSGVGSGAGAGGGSY